MTPDDIRLLYEYNSWANRRILDSCIVLSDQQVSRDLGSSFRSVRDTLVHIMGAEWIWHERWQGRAPSKLLDATEFPTMSSVRKRWSEVEKDLNKFVTPLKQVDLDAPREIRTLDGKIFKNPLWQMLQHLVNHGTYHRGQVTTMLRQLDATPAALDLIKFYRERAS
ncbi:MAG: DinB family protein [Acidobacteria bacterium]|nr:DinB family protein [Acidobacteriota bacterium]